jgi:hypothetical protein
MWQIKKNGLLIASCSKSENGFSFIEILLSLLIAMLLTNFMIQLYIVAFKQEYFLREKIAIEEKAKFIEFMLTREIQTAGFCGCNRFNNIDINFHIKKNYFPFSPIKIFSKDNHPFGKNIHPESDSLVLEGMSNKIFDILVIMKKTIKVGFQDVLKSEEPLMISDCNHADILIPDEIQYQKNTQIIKFNEKLNYDYKASIGKLIVTAFFIEKTRRKNCSGMPVYALYCYDLVGHKKTEFFSGVEEINFFYGVREEDKSMFFFKPLLSGSDFSKSGLIKISLKLSQGDTLCHSKEILYQHREFLIAMREMI